LAKVKSGIKVNETVLREESTADAQSAAVAQGSESAKESNEGEESVVMLDDTEALKAPDIEHLTYKPITVQHEQLKYHSFFKKQRLKRCFSLA
jgi:hypothetical protein